MDKHPKSLRIFFATEMWERYGFYVVQSLLALYLANHCHWPDKQIYTLVGSFTALTYLSPLVGGWIADNLIGQKRAILLGASILFMSYCFLALFDNQLMLITVLSSISVGTGLLKPNISSLLGNEYLQSCPRRESGFTIFYMGITTGIILGTTLPSYLSLHVSWSSSFASAALGMIFAFSIFWFGIRKYAIKDYNEHPFQCINLLKALSILALLWCLSFYILSTPQLANILFGLVVLLSSSYILYAVSKENKNQARQTLVIGLLCIISVMFWAFYFQMFMSLTLFISRMAQPTLFSIGFPAPYYVTIESIGMLVIGYFLARYNPQKTLRERGLITGQKFVLSLVFMTIAYGVIALVSHWITPGHLLSPLLIMPAYLFISLSELLLSPVGLAAITFLADKNKVSTMMGIFFVSLGVGAFLSGKLAALTAIPPGETDIMVLKGLYVTAFMQQLGILFTATLGCLIIYAVIRFLLTYDKGDD